MLVSQVLKLKVNISYQQAISFRETQRQFIAACNLVSQYIFDHGFILQQRTLQDRLYRKIRADYDMPSFLAQSVIKTVIAKYKTVKTLDIDRLARRLRSKAGNSIRSRLRVSAKTDRLSCAIRPVCPQVFL